MPAPPPSGTVTFLFSDIEGSTRLWESAPDAMRPALERHDELLRSVIDAHGGYVFATGGDGFGVAFARAGDALTAALEAQEALAAEAWPEGVVIRVRMGVHTGEASEREGDYFGPAVNRTARLMAVAHGGQVVCAQSTASLVDGASLLGLGEHRLRDLAAAEQVFQVGGGSFPALRSVDAVPTNLPTVRTDLIGRSEQVAALSDLVERERLVTLTGVGGVGKTRLALGVAAATAAGFTDGCWLVELSPVDDGDEVVMAVAAAMRAPITSADALVEYLADRRVLIVLDNCEHVLDASADLVDAVLAAAAEVHVVSTSREPLGLDGEHVRRVQSLTVPDAGASPREAKTTAAVRLFSERAAAASAGFTLDEDNVADVVEICRHLDGIPLAIELAAARVRAMAPAEIARRLDERFRLLAGGSRRSQERHRTLLATVSWSHDLLTEEERVVFRRLAIFPATFDLAAAEAVAGDGDGEVDVIDCVLRLVDRSLVVYDPVTDRYRLLETLRQYGADRLAEAGETEVTRDRHARFFLDLADRIAPEFHDARFGFARGVVAAEVENVRAAADWCIDTEQWSDLAALCLQLWGFFQLSAPMDITVWYQQVLDHEATVDDQVVVDCAGDLAWLETLNFGNNGRAVELAEWSHARAESAGVQVSVTACLAVTSAELYTGRPTEAARSSERAVAAGEARGDERFTIYALLVQSGALATLGDAERGAAVAMEALRRAEATGHQGAISASVVTAAHNCLHGSAEPDFAGSLDILDRNPVDTYEGDINHLWLDITWGITLLGLGRPAAVGRFARAARTADRLNSLNTLDYALRLLAVAAAEAGLVEAAVTLVDYTEVNLRPNRLEIPGQVWVQARLDEALTGHPDAPPTVARHRGDVMVLVDEVEAAVVPEERSPG